MVLGQLFEDCVGLVGAGELVRGLVQLRREVDHLLDPRVGDIQGAPRHAVGEVLGQLVVGGLDALVGVGLPLVDDVVVGRVAVTVAGALDVLQRRLVRDGVGDDVEGRAVEARGLDHDRLLHRFVARFVGRVLGRVRLTQRDDKLGLVVGVHLAVQDDGQQLVLMLVECAQN